MKLIALIAFIALAVITGVFLLTWRKKKKPIAENPEIKVTEAIQFSKEETKAKNDIVSGTYYLVRKVFINEIQYTPKSDIPKSHVEIISAEMESIVQNETPFAATSMGNLTLQYSNGKTIEIETIYNMGKSQYDPIIYLEGNQYHISEAFRNTIQELSQMN
ncbi:MAG: hypothetical protein Aureis2KO_25180 [Aureisphaera sp.]